MLFSLKISWDLSLTSCVITSKAVTVFEDDKRFKAVEREADREDLFRNYLVDLQKKVCISFYFFQMLRHLVIFILVNFDIFKTISLRKKICKHKCSHMISGCCLIVSLCSLVKQAAIKKLACFHLLSKVQ